MYLIKRAFDGAYFSGFGHVPPKTTASKWAPRFRDAEQFVSPGATSDVMEFLLGEWPAVKFEVVERSGVAA